MSHERKPPPDKAWDALEKMSLAEEAERVRALTDEELDRELTAHGKDPKATKYKMPNPELPKLDFAALKAGKQAPKMAEFMGKVVKPQMAKILQQPEYTETNPKGFGCLECHQQKK